MMVTARKTEQSATSVTYAYGFGEQLDQQLTIDTASGELLKASASSSATGKIYLKIKRDWQATGEFPPGAVFAS